MNKKMLEFARKQPRTIDEIIEHFGIDKKHRETVRRRIHENNIKLKENRGRKKIEL